MDVGMTLFNLDCNQLETALPTIAEAGLAAVEVSYIPFASDDQRLRDLSSRYAAAGTPWRTIHAHFGDAGDIASSIEGVRRHGVATHVDLIERASVVSAGIIVVHPGRGVRDVTRIPGQEAACRRSLDELVPRAEAAGVVLALENMLPRHSYEHAGRLRSLVDSYNSPFVRTTFDCGHAHVGEGVPHVVQAMGSTIATVHLADNDSSGDLHLQPPYGTINWTDVFRGLEAAGYTGPMLVETRPWGKGRPSRLVLEMKALYNTAMGNDSAYPRLVVDERSGGWARCRGCNHFWVETEAGLTCACDDEPLDYMGV